MKIIDLSSAMKQKNKYIGHIREFEDYYEYCIIDEYEEKYSNFQSDSIQMDKVFAVTLETKEKFLIAGILFYKSCFNLDEVLNWLDCNEIKYIEPGKRVLSGASEIVMGIRFDGRPIIQIRKGNKRIEFNENDFAEITEVYNSSMNKVDTSKSKYVRNEEKGLVVYLNNEKLEYIPRIDFDKDKDFILSNGNIIYADYIGIYNEENLGFFIREEPARPISIIGDLNTDVYIDIFEREDGAKVCSVEYNYVIDTYLLGK